MKKILVLLLLFCAANVSSFAQDAVEGEVEDSSISESYTLKKQMDWGSLVHSFGNIKTYEKVEHTFKFTNVSTAPIVILDVKVECGCTAPEWTQEPVMPGEDGEILIKFNSWKTGVFTKPIKVYTNAENYPTKLFITAIVEDGELFEGEEAETAPKEEIQKEPKEERSEN